MQAPAANVIVPVSVGVPAPIVTQTTQSQYTLKSGDTYVSLSTMFYGHADYAEALRAYNRTDAFASDALRAGNLVPGEKLWIPPLSELEKKAPETLPRFATTPVPTVPQSAYKVVAPGGEMLYSIGKTVLRDENGWMKIRSLNPQLDPSQPVPVGTKLVMPEGAVVPPENRS